MTAFRALPPIGDAPITEASISALVDAVERCAIPQVEFSHARHLLLALHYVRAYGAEDALRRMRSALVTLAAQHTPRFGYHETMTAAWIAIVAAHVEEHGAGTSVEEVAAALLRRWGGAAGAGGIHRFYSRDRLLSTEARAAFVPPDLLPLPRFGDGVRIRVATAADLPEINAIYAYWVERSTCTFATRAPSDEERRTWFSLHGEAHPVTVAVEGAGQGAVIGWGSLSMWNPREAYARSVEDSVYVRADRHRQGLGRRILADLLSRAMVLGHRTVVAQVSADQAPSLALHRDLGFEEAGRLREIGYKFDRWLDIVILQRLL